MNQKKLERRPDRVIYFDYLRILATVAVIVLHVSNQKWGSTDVNSFEWNVFNIYDSAVRWAVPIFVMISGALFLNNENPVSIKKLYTKNIFRIITAFAFWSLFYTLIYNIGKPIGLKSMMVTFLNGHYHMWFLFMIVGLYIVVPVLRKITESLDVTKYFLILALIFTFIVPYLLKLPVLSEFSGLYESLELHLVLGFSGYFVCGYYLYRVDLSKKAQNIIYLLGILAFIFTAVFTALLSIYRQKASNLFYDELAFNVMLESIAVFVFVKYKLNRKFTNEKLNKLVLNLSKYSFGIYLIHIFIMDIFRIMLGFNTLSFNALLSVPVITIIVFLISLLLSLGLNKIPFLKKYIV